MNDDHFFVTPEYIVESLELLYPLLSFTIIAIYFVQKHFPHPVHLAREPLILCPPKPPWSTTSI